jgi:hypothetical protein
MMAYKCSVSISNETSRPLTFHLEPWGEQFPMPPGSTFQVVAEAKKQGEIEIVYEENDVLVYGWEGSVLSIFSNGKEII